MTPKLRIAWFTDSNPRRWDEPGAPFGYDWRSADYQMDVGRALDRARFDLMIYADNNSFSTWQDSIAEPARMGKAIGHLHSAIALAVMSTVTRNLGFVATMSTDAYPPYLLAREIATLDNMSGGRAGWNVVTAIGNTAARNFGRDTLVGRDERYAQAEEFIEVCFKLWESWDRDAIIMDRETHNFVRPGSVHEIGHRGKYYSVHGALNTPPGPQGRPLIVQAGGSPRGMDFAAKYADMVISHSNSVETMKEFCSGIKDRAKSFGRDPKSVKVFFTRKPFIGQTHQEAVERRQRVLDHAAKDPNSGLMTVSLKMNIEAWKLPLDEPLKEAEVLAAGGVAGAFYQHYTKDGKGPTLRELAAEEAILESMPMVGTADEIAQDLQELQEEVGFDGLAIREALSPLRVAEVTELLVPALVRRGMLRSGFRYKTLRENMFDEEA